MQVLNINCGITMGVQVALCILQGESAIFFNMEAWIILKRFGDYRAPNISAVPLKFFKRCSYCAEIFLQRNKTNTRERERETDRTEF